MPVLQFKGKSFVENHHLTVKYHQLIPNQDASLTDKVSLQDNLIIHGDNLIALKALLPQFRGKIKCIYIDPPYNTGKEGWIYNDNVNSPMIQEWIKQNTPIDNEDLTRHDKWLCMMMPRLKLLRELLRDDGVIFVSIDDNEVHHLRMLMDEVFGEANYVGTIVWRNVTDNNPTRINKDNEFIICFARNASSLPKAWKSAISSAKELLQRLQEELLASDLSQEDKTKELRQFISDNGEILDTLTRYNRIDSFGIYTGSESVHNPHAGGYDFEVLHPETKQPMRKPANGYRFPETTFRDMQEQGIIIYGEDENRIVKIKKYLNDYEDTLRSVIVMDGRLGSYDMKRLFKTKKKVFDNPKPVDLIRKILSFVTDTLSNDIILDSFAGSGTTAQAALELNAKDNGNRKFILIEMEDYADDVTAERVRRVINGVESARSESLKNGVDATFSFFELGNPITEHDILSGDSMPIYEDFARYLFYTATGEEFNPEIIDESSYFIGESSQYIVYLFYKPDLDYLKKAALTLEHIQQFPDDGSKTRLVFAPTRYVDKSHLQMYNVKFVMLPFDIYQL